jgi:hypothetical protein
MILSAWAQLDREPPERLEELEFLFQIHCDTLLLASN